MNRTWRKGVIQVVLWMVLYTLSADSKAQIKRASPADPDRIEAELLSQGLQAATTGRGRSGVRRTWRS